MGGMETGSRLLCGNAVEANASKTKGWVVGHMHDGLGKYEGAEVKLWRYEGPIDYGMKIFSGTEFIVIYGGELSIAVRHRDESREIVLRAEMQDYVILPPGTVKSVKVIRAPAFGVTVRWPSAPDRNKVLPV